MNGLHHLVAAGKVLYLVGFRLPDAHYASDALTLLQGVSDTPAWVVSKANMYAKLTGKTPFVIYQGAWNVMQRDFERDIIPMAREEGKHAFLCEPIPCLH